MEAIEIRIRGQIDKSWSDWLGGLTIAHNAAGDTVLTGSVRDQSALVGLLNRLSGLGLRLVSVGPFEGCTADKGGSKTCES
ncbi:MAG: hypothetical protein A2147_03745 [Chloroflexi bacterium RBG_16_57_8]|nr:MAG: hypothetical protein A2147_03745 [Chloroflexi bacterium RBG_16_57_8]